jgi:hypothetical protein
MYDYLRALHQRFCREPDCAEQRREIEMTCEQLRTQMDREERRKLLRLIDVQDEIRNESSLESFVSGFRLAWGIAKELEETGLYSFDEEESERIRSAQNLSR